MANWTERQRTLGLAALYVLALGAVVFFTLQDTFAVPHFVYQDF
jgi:hypothetical protein